MSEKSPVYVGIDLLRSAGRQSRAYVYAALDEARELIALGTGDRDEVLAYLGGQAAAHIAIATPRAPNTGVANNPDTYPEGRTPSARKVNARLCEVLLQQEVVAVESTSAKVKQCPRRVQLGFDLYRKLSAFGYTPFPNPENGLLLLETHTEGIFWRWLGGKHTLPDSLEGRIQRQLILFDRKLPVADAMDFFLEVTRYKLIQGDLPDQDILPFDELNALAVAQVAWLAAQHPDRLDLIGDPDEGQIILPKMAAEKIS